MASPPMIGKAGNLTIFITPPPKSAGSPKTNGSTPSPSPSPSPVKEAPSPAKSPPPNPPPKATGSRKTNGSTPSPSSSPVKAAPSPANLPPPNPPPKTTGPRKTNGCTPSPSPSPVKAAPAPAKPPPVKPPPVQVPPAQFEKPAAKSSGSAFGFFWDAVARAKDAYSSLDEHLANWFGLDQSKYQWALNDYYENSGKGKEDGKGGKTKELTTSKEQIV